MVTFLSNARSRPHPMLESMTLSGDPTAFDHLHVISCFRDLSTSCLLTVSCVCVCDLDKLSSASIMRSEGATVSAGLAQHRPTKQSHHVCVGCVGIQAARLALLVGLLQQSIPNLVRTG